LCVYYKNLKNSAQFSAIDESDESDSMGTTDECIGTLNKLYYKIKGNECQKRLLQYRVGAVALKLRDLTPDKNSFEEVVKTKQVILLVMRIFLLIFINTATDSLILDILQFRSIN